MNESTEDTTPLQDLATAEGMKSFVEELLPIAKGNLERDGHLVPLAFLIVTKHPKTGADLPSPVPLIVSPDRLANNREKDSFVEAIQRLVVEMKACGVIMIMESWTTPEGWGEEAFKTAISKYGSVSNMPDRREAICVTAEHSKFKTPYFHMGVFERDAAGKPVLESWISHETAQVSGRFLGLLQHIN